MAVRLGRSAARFAVELDGAQVGFATSVAGGEPFAEVVAEPPVRASVDSTTWGRSRFEPIVIEAGASMASGWYAAIDEVLVGTAQAHDGAILLLDQNFGVLQRLEWKAGVITEVGFPKATAGAKGAAVARVVIRPEATSLSSGSGTVSAGPLGKGQRAWNSSAFRFVVAGLESASTRVAEVSSVTVHRGEEGDVLTIDDVELHSGSDRCRVRSRGWFNDLRRGQGQRAHRGADLPGPVAEARLMSLELRRDRRLPGR